MGQSEWWTKSKVVLTGGGRPQSWPGPAWCLKESQVGFSSGAPGHDMMQLVFQKAHTSLCGRRAMWAGVHCRAGAEQLELPSQYHSLVPGPHHLPSHSSMVVGV